MKKQKDKFFSSVFLIFVLIFTMLIGFSVAIFITIMSFKEDFTVFTYIGYLTFTVVFPIIAFISTANRSFSIIEFSEKGVKKSLFKIFCKIDIKWEEMLEVRYYSSGVPWLFLSKIPLHNFTFNKVIGKKKEVIIIQLDKKTYQIFRKYSNKEVINLPIKLIENFENI